MTKLIIGNLYYSEIVRTSVDADKLTNQLYKCIFHIGQKYYKKYEDTYTMENLSGTGGSKISTTVYWPGEYFKPIPREIEVLEDSSEMLITVPVEKMSVMRQLAQDRLKPGATGPRIEYVKSEGRWLASLQDFKLILEQIFLEPATAGLIPCDCPMNTVLTQGCQNKNHI